MFLPLRRSAATSGSHKLGSARICRHTGRSVVKMKYPARQASTANQRLSGNEQVRREIQSFLRALRSYPDRFAKEPHITFEQHRGGLTRAASEVSRRRL